METIYTVHQKRIKLKALSDVTNLWVWGDVHRDAVACDVKRWQWFLNKSAQDDPTLTYYLGMGDYCMPLSTEILTKNGWKKHHDIEVGEIVCAYDSLSDKLKWTPLRGLYYSPSQKTYRLKSKSFDFVCTNNHGWFVSHQRDKSIKKIPLSNLKSQHRIKVVAELEDSVTFPYLSVTPEECYLLGWVVTDGHIREKGRGINVNITQSPKKYLAKLKDVFSNKYTSSYTNSINDCETINIKTSIARGLFQKFGFKSKDDLPEIATHLNQECRRAMLLAFHEAEGWMERGRWNFAQLEGGVLEAYRILTTLSGIRIGVSHKKTNGVVTHKESGRVNVTVYDLNITEAANEIVWCPMTDLSSVVARQGNTITITGNCDFASSTEQKKLTRNEFHETTMDTLDALVEKRNRDFAGEIKQMRGKLLGLMDGNHNWRFTNGKTASEDLAERMDCPTLGWLTHYTLTFDISTNSAINVYIVACHGKAGGKRIGTSINQVEDLKVIFPAADLYIMAHDHNRGAWPVDVLLPVSWQGEVHLKQKRQFLCRSGSFMKGYEPGKSQYTVGRLLRPADLGALKLRIGFHRDKEGGGDIRKVDIEAVI